MNAFELKGTRPDGKEVFIYACGECGRLDQHKDAAEKCCGPCSCGKTKEPWQDRCVECSSKDSDERLRAAEEKRYAAAKRVPFADYGGAMLVSGDHFYDEPDDLFDDSLPEDPPREAWGVYGMPLSIDANRLLESALEEHHEDAEDNISKEMVDELQTFLDGWCKRTGIVSYFQDDAVLVDLSAEADRWLADAPEKNAGGAT